MGVHFLGLPCAIDITQQPKQYITVAFGFTDCNSRILTESGDKTCRNRGVCVLGYGFLSHATT
jgi:hypothetical protein